MSTYITRKFLIRTPDQPDVLIRDDGYSVRAEWSTGQSSTTSIGIRRPPPKPDAEVEVINSLDGKYFYLPGYVPTDPVGGNWMGRAEYASSEEAKEQCRKGVFGESYLRIDRLKENRVLYRELLAFASWRVDTDNQRAKLSKDDPLVQDFLSMCHAFDMADLKRFEEAIAFTGRKYGWILAKIGPPVTSLPEPPPTVISD